MIRFDGTLYVLGHGVYLSLGIRGQRVYLFHQAKNLRGIMMRFLANTLGRFGSQTFSKWRTLGKESHRLPGFPVSTAPVSHTLETVFCLNAKRLEFLPCSTRQGIAYHSQHSLPKEISYP